eukprot:6174259-Pleurochrysis_carterae.AAC.4
MQKVTDTVAVDAFFGRRFGGPYIHISCRAPRPNASPRRSAEYKDRAKHLAMRQALMLAAKASLGQGENMYG